MISGIFKISLDDDFRTIARIKRW